MKRLSVLLVLVVVLVVAFVMPTHETNKGYYLYPAIGYTGTGADLPSGEMVEFAVNCVIFFKGVKTQDMIPTSDQVIDADKCTVRRFTLSEIYAIRITYHVRIFIRHSTLYLWNGELLVESLEWIGNSKNSWAQYKCFDESGGWSIGFYVKA